jgi:uncharacterized membrane protein HdeD (DUF308 family)
MIVGTLLDDLSKKWWALLLRGIFAILFGLLAFAMPGITIASLVLLYGIYVFADGIFAIWAGATARAWGLVLSGVVSVLAGIYMFVSPAGAARILIYVIAFWAILRGILEIYSATLVRKVIDNEWMLVLGGILSILFGVALFLSPAAGALGMVWLIGAFAIIYGVVMIILAFRLKSLPERVRNAVKGA